MIPLTMPAARVAAPGHIEIIEAPVPIPDANEVLVALEGCGVCASNIPPFEGREWFSYPMEAGQLGHEGWGRVAAIGEGVSEFAIGQRVAMLSNHAYAPFDKAEASAVVALPELLGDAPFPGEPLGCALNIFRRCEIQAGDTVAVVGIGFLGAILVQMAKHAGAVVYAVSRREYSLNFARQFGADQTVPLVDEHWRVIERVKELTDGRFCDVVIEATGKEAPLNLAAELCRERGRLIIAGYHQDGMRSVNLQLWGWRGLDVINAHEREQAVYTRGIADAAGEIANQKWNPALLFTHEFGLDGLQEALTLTRERPDGFMKALIRY